MVRKNRKRPASSARRLHRSLGAGAALFVFFMVLSGLAINHSNVLGLDQRQVSQPYMLGWYGLGEPENIDSFAVGDNWLSFAGSQLYLNDKSVATVSGGVGAISNGDLLIAAGSDELLLLDHDGNLVERLPWTSIGTSAIKSIGLAENTGVMVKSGDRLWLADTNLLNWRVAEDDFTGLTWAQSQVPPGDLQQAINRLYRGNGLTMERVLLDLHSGRIFGPVGILVYDLLALALGFLSISGLVLWFRGRRNKKPK
jgi:hypothetical protein